MGWTVEIQHSAGTATIGDQFKFNFRLAKQITGRNTVEYIDLYLDVSGQVSAATPALVYDGFKVYYDLLAAQSGLNPVTVTIKLDGVEKWKFTPAGSVAGPAVIDLDTPEEDGNGSGRWVFTFTIHVRLPGNNFAGLHDLRTQLTVVKNDIGQVIQKIWQATGKATTIATALAGIMRFKPAGKVSEEVTRSFDPDPTASATWVWRLTTLAHLETISIIGGGKSYEVDPQAGVNIKPLLHLARAGAAIARLEGVVRGPTNQKLVAPAAHWKESAIIKRMEALESQSKPTVSTDEDVQLGQHRLNYSEVYVSTDGKFPEPNHGAHAATLQIVAEPADGAIAR